MAFPFRPYSVPYDLWGLSHRTSAFSPLAGTLRFRLHLALERAAVQVSELRMVLPQGKICFPPMVHLLSHQTLNRPFLRKCLPGSTVIPTLRRCRTRINRATLTPSYLTPTLRGSTGNGPWLGRGEVELPCPSPRHRLDPPTSLRSREGRNALRCCYRRLWINTLG